MRFFLHLLLLLLPAAALAQQSGYELSCENVARIRIGRMDDTYYNVETYNGFFHFLYFDLKKEAGPHFEQIIDKTPYVTFVYRGEEWTMRSLDLVANGRPLRNDAPSLSGYTPDAVIIAIIREQDAFDAARSVCPALVPRKVIVDWKRDWEPRAGK